MPLYLFVASICNVTFLVVAVRDARSKREPRSASMALLTMATSELIWVVPCFIQCFIILIWGPVGDYSARGEPGCQIQGFYSVFSSLLGMLSTTQMAYLTYRMVCSPSPVSGRSAAAASIAMVSVVLLISLLGVGSYVSSKEGFCYSDWDNTFHVVMIDMILVPSTVLTIGFFGLVMARGYSVVHDGLPPRAVWLLYIGYFVLSWFIWWMASFYAIASAEFPKGMMIAGGILGHLTAAVNPVLYGVFWRRWFMGVGQKVEAQPLTSMTGQ